MLRDIALRYYLDQGKCCSEAMILAVGEAYKLNITPAEAQLFIGFRGGIGCGGTCGALAGAIGALSRMFQGQEALKEICPQFVSYFTERLGCGSCLCSILEPQYKTPERRCAATVVLAADALEEFLTVRSMQHEAGNF